MSLLYYMFQSILNTFAFGYFFARKKLIIFTDGGYPPPFAENSVKIINLIFEPFPKSCRKKKFFSALDVPHPHSMKVYSLYRIMAVIRAARFLHFRYGSSCISNIVFQKWMEIH